MLMSEPQLETALKSDRNSRRLLAGMMVSILFAGSVHRDSRAQDGLEKGVVVAGTESAPENPEPSTALEPVPKDTIHFKNGYWLHGSLREIDPGNAVRWWHPDAEGEIDFVPGSVTGVEFGERPLPAFQRNQACRVRLANGDEVEGNLLECDLETIVLESWYAGRITIPRSQVRLLTPQPAEPPPVFEGPSGAEGWTFGSIRAGIPNAGQWSYKRRAFYATKSASVARDVNLPDVARIEFDLTWKGMLYIAIALYTDYLEPVSLQSKETEPEFGGFYSLQLSSYTVNLLAITQADPIRYLGQTSVPAFSQKTKAHVDVRVNKAKHTTTLMVDGAIVKQWIDTDGFVGKGTGLRFVHQGQGAVKLNNLKISEWDGQFEEKLSNRPNQIEDTVTLRKGDKLAGKIASIAGGRVRVEAADGTVAEVPMGEVRHIELASRDVEPVGREMANVKAIFRNGGTVTFQLQKWTTEAVTGTNASLGNVIFRPAAFERMDVDLK